jgi:hypothetical protein
VERTELLERDVAVEIGLPREVDDRHPTATNLAHDFVSTDGALHVKH